VRHESCERCFGDGRPDVEPGKQACGLALLGLGLAAFEVTHVLSVYGRCGTADSRER
jgi:hypothetical protein